uniref:uncharacterized protein LOC122589457 n=1 Tax=Erigeron canadensis TaxID=72917 RepID=UPI001CB89EAE|nr:uncharacterized protein LOC122589457 [Erigeron canadensis]
MASSSSKVTLKLLIDKKGKKVLFAEAGKDFIDFLFSILTLPIGTVINILNSKGMVGCLGNLYQSVSDLSNDYMQPNQQKDVVLKPKSSLSSHQVPLLQLDDTSSSPPTTETKLFYKCAGCNSALLSPISGTQCPYCRNAMSTLVTMYVPKPSSAASVPAAATTNIGEVAGGFVKGVVTYMVMDDLVIAPMSTISSITMLNKFNIKEVGALEEKVVHLGMDEVLFAEAGKDFIDFLFSLLTLPIGTVIKLINNQGMVGGCLSNLCFSVFNLTNMQSNLPKDVFNTSLSSHQAPLLPPEQCSSTPPTTETKFITCWDCSNPILSPTSGARCSYCKKVMCKVVTMYVPEPTASGRGPDTSVGGFVKGVATYMVMDDLVVEPISTMSSITLLMNKFNIKEVGDLEEKVVYLGMNEKTDGQNHNPKRMTNSVITLKLLVNKRDKKIMFAEANKDFVDFLFYILTLPIGAITKLLAKEPLSGSLGDLYQSIENLNGMYILQSKTKETVLNPQSTYVPNQDLLLISKDPPTETKFYRCPNRCKYVTNDPKTLCPNCRWAMSEEMAQVPTETAKGTATTMVGEVGFVKEVVTYMVMDDLTVKPMSTISTITLLNQMSIKDVGVLEEKEVQFGVSEGLKLLKASMECKNVLTSVFLDSEDHINIV